MYCVQDRFSIWGFILLNTFVSSKKECQLDRAGFGMSEIKNYRVLLYYQYVTIEDPEVFASQHLNYCKELELKGRILVASEGINGTVSGTWEQTEKYMNDMHNDPRFAEMVFKIDESDQHVLKKCMYALVRRLVTFRLEDDINPHEVTRKYLRSKKEFYEALQAEDTIVLDAKNDYEFDVGHFRGAISPDIETLGGIPTGDVK